MASDCQNELIKFYKAISNPTIPLDIDIEVTEL